jgi:Pyruvate/2-oxoacid:ferredoxin oxidoreductase gamma subunit
MLGALSASNTLPFETEILLETILDNVKQKEINRKAFTGGQKAFKSCKE